MKNRKQRLVHDKMLDEQRETEADTATAAAVSGTAVPLGGQKRHCTDAKTAATNSGQTATPARAQEQPTQAPIERAPRKRGGGRARKLTQADQAELRMREAQAATYATDYRELLQWAQLSKLLEQDTAVEVLADAASDLARTGRY